MRRVLKFAVAALLGLSLPGCLVLGPMLINNGALGSLTPGAVATNGGNVTTLAGQATSGYLDATGPTAKFLSPQGVAVSSAGDVYVTDHSLLGGDGLIRKVTPDGKVTTLAGSNSVSPIGEVTASSFADGQGTNARFNYPTGITIDSSGNLFISDSGNHCIRKVTSSGAVTTLAGSTAGYADGNGTSAKFSVLRGIAIDSSGNLYVAEAGNNFLIRKVTAAGAVTTLAGSTAGYVDGNGTAAKFSSSLNGIAVDAAGNVYVADQGNYRIRKITPSGIVSTLAGGTQGTADGVGTSAQFLSPHGITIDSAGVLYVTDNGLVSCLVRRISSSGAVSTISGGTAGVADGRGTAAKFNFGISFAGIAIDKNGLLYVADMASIRKIQ